MPLLNGTWKLNVNGNEGTLNLMSIDAGGNILGSIVIPGAGGLGIQFMGSWNEAAQAIYFETMSSIVQPAISAPGSTNFRAQFFGYLFSSQDAGSPGADIKWVLCGEVSSSMASPFPGLQVNSRRTKFGWYAEIKQVM
jgi:hypothetical protein